MATVRSKNTKLERNFFEALEKAGITGFSRHQQDLPGKPDIVFENVKLAVFLDSCFWHACPSHLRRPSSNTAYWEAKIARNIKRDGEVNKTLEGLGWSVLRLWEHDLKNPEDGVKTISLAIKDRETLAE